MEFIDTLFLALGKRPIIFLHIWHHTTVTLFCYYAIKNAISFGHYFMFFNCIIHFIMYGYYALMTQEKYKKRLRKHSYIITFLQTFQMIIGIAICSYAIIYPY